MESEKFGTVVSVLASLQKDYGAVMLALEAVFYVVGIVVVINALMRARHLTTPGTSVTGFNVITSVVIGICIVAAPSFIAAVANTFFNLDCFNSQHRPGQFLDYATGNDYCGKPNTLLPVFLFVKLVGYITVLRGFLMLRRFSMPGESQDLMTAGFVRILFGVFCINITQTLYFLSGVFGFTLAAEIISM